MFGKLYPEGSKSVLGNIYFIIFWAVLFSILTYLFVENKIRFKKSRKVTVGLFLTIIVIGICAYTISTTDDRVEYTEEQISADFPILDTDDDNMRFMKEYQKALIPRPEDYAVINGRKQPNSSKNPNRQSTTVAKLQAAKRYYYLYEAAPPKKFMLEK